MNQMQRDIRMKNISKKCNANTENGKVILFAFCFSIYENCMYHDFFLAQSLKKRGCKIIPLICGGMQEGECSAYGGAWGKKNCGHCIGCDKRVWEKWSGYNCISAKDEIDNENKKNVKEYVNQLDIQKYKEWTYEGYPIGKWAWMRYCNKKLVSKVSVIDKEFEFSLRTLTYNIVLMIIATKKVCDRIKPDIVYSNDSTYYPYAIAEYVAKEQGIPFYNAYGYNKDTYSYAYNAPTMKMELSGVWSTYKDHELTDSEYKYICDYLKQRRTGSTALINSANPSSIIKNIKPNAIYGEIDRHKRTALMATNVSWDGAALGREIQFDSIQDWVIETVAYFEGHPEWQLILRSHPAEKADILPEAREQFVPMILEYYHNKLPNNIILIPSDADINIYDLFNDVSLGVVYTSTVGLEMTASGVPVVTAGVSPYYNRGFTYDTDTKEEYFQMIDKLMVYGEKKEVLENNRKQALKFFYLYYFKYMIPNYWCSYTYEGGIKMKIKSGEELFPGQNPVWDYICDSIIEGKPIFSENRIVPYSVVDE